MASDTGDALIDFGAWPGSCEASVAVTGQTSIVSTSHVEAWFMREASADHTAEDHSYAAIWIALTCGTPVDGDGFTIYARAAEPFIGTFKVRFVWAD